MGKSYEFISQSWAHAAKFSCTFLIIVCIIRKNNAQLFETQKKVVKISIFRLEIVILIILN